MGTLLLLQVDPSGRTTYGGFCALTSAAKCQARDMRRLVWETKGMIRAELFLREKDQWCVLATHIGCIFKEMLRSAKHVGIRKSNCQHRCRQKKDCLPP